MNLLDVKAIQQGDFGELEEKKNVEHHLTGFFFSVSENLFECPFAFFSASTWPRFSFINVTLSKMRPYLVLKHIKLRIESPYC